MFLLRVIFWLTIVFTSMAWTVDGVKSGPGALGKAVSETGPVLASTVRQAAMSQITAGLAGNGDDPARQLIAKAAMTYFEQPGAAPMPHAKPLPNAKEQSWCTKSVETCAADAARLTALIVAVERAGDGVEDEPRHPLKPALR